MYPRIRALREDRDLKQRELAELLNISQTGYSKYETGENDVPTAILDSLADFYETSVDYIMGRTDEKKPLPPARDRKHAVHIHTKRTRRSRTDDRCP